MDKSEGKKKVGEDGVTLKFCPLIDADCNSNCVCYVDEHCTNAMFFTYMHPVQAK